MTTDSLLHVGDELVGDPSLDIRSLFTSDLSAYQQEDLFLSEFLGNNNKDVLDELFHTSTAENNEFLFNTQFQCSPDSTCIHGETAQHSTPTSLESFQYDSAPVYQESPSSTEGHPSPWSLGTSLSVPVKTNACTSQVNNTATSQSNDICIDLGDTSNSDLLPSSPSERKTGSLVLTEEECHLLNQEGIELPTDMPLTKAEERSLKRIRRKIKNKQSAADSRRRKKDYIAGLEKRVEHCTQKNSALNKKVSALEQENKSLMEQLRRLQSIVSQYNPSKLKAGSFLMVIILSFSLILGPKVFTKAPSYQSLGRSRALLDIPTDEFGNIESVAAQFDADSMSLRPPPPWKYQSPVLVYKVSYKNNSPLTATHDNTNNDKDL